MIIYQFVFVSLRFQPPSTAVTVSRDIVGAKVMQKTVVKPVRTTSSRLSLSSALLCVANMSLHVVTGMDCGTCSNRCFKNESIFCCDSECSAGCFGGDSNHCYVRPGMCMVDSKIMHELLNHVWSDFACVQIKNSFV